MIETARNFLLSRFGNYSVTPQHVSELESRDRSLVLEERRCSTCKHWEPPSPPPPNPTAWQLEMRARTQATGTCCSTSPLIGTEGESIYTAPDFGCVLHEPK